MEELSTPLAYRMARGEIKKDTAEQRRIKQKKAFLALFNNRCFYCDETLDIKTVTRDHLYPKSKGGPTHRANLVPACKKCNQIKADMEPEIFINVFILGVCVNG